MARKLTRIGWLLCQIYDLGSRLAHNALGMLQCPGSFSSLWGGRGELPQGSEVSPSKNQEDRERGEERDLNLQPRNTYAEKNYSRVKEPQWFYLLFFPEKFPEVLYRASASRSICVRSGQVTQQQQGACLQCVRPWLDPDTACALVPSTV